MVVPSQPTTEHLDEQPGRGLAGDEHDPPNGGEPLEEAGDVVADLANVKNATNYFIKDLI